MRRKVPRNLLSLFIPSFLFSLSTAGDILTPTQSLSNGETLVSAAGTFRLGFFSPTNSNNRYIGIWYNNISVQNIVWVANRQNPINDSTGVLSILIDGALIITAGNSTVVWTSGAVPVATNPIAQLLDNGNFVVTQVNRIGIKITTWQSFNYPTDTLLPGMKLGWDLKSGLNRNITSWMSPTDPSPGPYTIFIDLKGDPQLVTQSGSSLFWRGGPWDGLRFAGIPEMDSDNAFNFTFIDDLDEISYSFSIIDNAIISRVIVDHFGTVQRLVWLDQGSMWNAFWSAPTDQCDRVSPCGPFGVCNTSDSPICNCLQGFKPKSPYDWALRDGTDGCIRQTQLDCTNGTDGFMTMNGAKLPDTTNATVDLSLNIDECRVQCLENCSCTAYASADISGTGSGCIIWTTELTDLRVYDDGGQNLYVRLAAADLDKIKEQSHKSKLPIAAIIGGAVSGMLLLACVGCCIWRRKKGRRAESVTTSFKDATVRGEDFKLPLFDIDTIATATDNFSMQNKLGEGGFGPVYKGKLGGGEEIAVKRLARTSVQGIDEFKNEVMVIAKLQHRNLVRLLGCCIQGEERILVYEYMPNKSLDAFLFANGTSLDWQTRYRIILGVARGMLYLHHESRLRIIHRDLKASNILLDANMNPKISDFGMARIFGGDETEVNTCKVVGTYGYMSPEYAMDGIFSIKSDVFSFGVLVLEIISGKKNRGAFFSEHLNLLGYAWNLWREGNGLELVDDTIGYSFAMVEALKCIKIGLLCVQERPKNRPTMSSVVLMLGSDSAVLPHPKQPGFVASKYSFDTNVSSSKKESVTVNDVTVTVLDGR